MKLEYLEYLIKVYEAGSVNKAGKELHTSPQNVSRVMKQLEDDFAFTLFNRTAHGVIFTPEGLEVLALAKNLLSMTKAFKKGFAEKKQDHDTEGEFVIVSTLVQYATFLTECVLDFNKLYPKIKISLLETDFLNGLRLVEQNEQYLGILPNVVSRKYSAVPAEYLGKLSFYSLNFDEICIFSGINSPISKQKSVSLKTLSNYDIAMYVRNDIRDSFWMQVLNHFKLSNRIKFFSGNATAFYRKIIDNGFISLTTKDAYNSAALNNNRQAFYLIPIQGENLLTNNIVIQMNHTLDAPKACFVEYLKMKFH